MREIHANTVAIRHEKNHVDRQANGHSQSRMHKHERTSICNYITHVYCLSLSQYNITKQTMMFWIVCRRNKIIIICFNIPPLPLMCADFRFYDLQKYFLKVSVDVALMKFQFRNHLFTFWPSACSFLNEINK